MQCIDISFVSKVMVRSGALLSLSLSLTSRRVHLPKHLDVKWWSSPTFESQSSPPGVACILLGSKFCCILDQDFHKLPSCPPQLPAADEVVQAEFPTVLLVGMHHVDLLDACRHCCSAWNFCLPISPNLPLHRFLNRWASMLQTSMMKKTLDLILGFQSPFTPPTSTQLPQSGIGSKALLSGNLQSGKFTSICAGTYLIDKWLQQQEHNFQDTDEQHAYGGQLSTSNHFMQQLWVGGWQAVGECLPPFIHSFLPVTTKESCRVSRLGLIWKKESDWIQGEEYEEWV